MTARGVFSSSARRLLVASHVFAVASLVVAACNPRAPSPAAATPPAVAGAEAKGVPAPQREAVTEPSLAAASTPAAPPPAPEPPREVGPYQIPFGDAGTRSVYFAVPPRHASGQRLIANLHGMCNPPAYACGYWVHAGSERGFLVCPAGNAECGPGVSTWTESFSKIDDDLESSIDAVEAAYPGEIDRDQGGILTGFSRGASVAPLIAERHPGRWPYLVIVEATVALDPTALRKAGVRAVALVAGEIGANVYSHKAICDALTKQGFPARCWVMPKAGHWYSANIDQIMGDAIDWLVTN